MFSRNDNYPGAPREKTMDAPIASFNIDYDSLLMAISPEDMIILETNDGEQIDFANLCGIELDGHFYVLLRPNSHGDLEKVGPLIDDNHPGLIVEVMDPDADHTEMRLVEDPSIIRAALWKYYWYVVEDMGGDAKF